MNLQKIKKINNLTKKIEKTYNELQKLKTEFERKNIMLSKLQKELNELTKIQ